MPSGSEKVPGKGGKRVQIKSIRREESAGPYESSGKSNEEYLKGNDAGFMDMAVDLSTVRSVFLRLLSVVYFSAFLSIYLQIEGLFGSSGVTPAKAKLQLTRRSSEECVRDNLSFLCFLAPKLGISIHHSMELVAIVGVLISAIALLCSHCCLSFIMAIQWILYLNIYQIGGTFMSFQWDVLLLEAGFLAILVAPWLPTKSSQSGQPRDLITLWMVRWLLFRLMFSSGVVKLMSGCSTWWGLTALNYHFESQCLPTPLAYYIHGLPQWILRIMVVGTYFIEIVAPFAFLTPFRLLHRFSFWLQILFQISIILTGNYNFFNFLTIVLCISLLDADFFRSSSSRGARGSAIFRFVTRSISFSLIGLGLYFTKNYFDLKLTSENTISSKIAFNRVEFDAFIAISVPLSIVLGIFNLAIEFTKATMISMFELKGVWNKLSSLVLVVVYGLFCALLFAVTLVPYSSLHKETRLALWPPVKELHSNWGKFQITSSYGLFRRMTGTDGGRPEVILEYSDDQNGPWKEFHFLYKPGNVSTDPGFIVPHQPRLDWQMWFAALQTYHETPWLLSLSYRLLQGETTVQKLLDFEKNPRKAPKFIRASLYHYTFTKISSGSGDTWTRTKTQEYMPNFSLDHTTLVEFIRNLGYLDADLPEKVKINHNLTYILDLIRTFLQSYEPELIIWGSLVSLFSLVFTSKLLK